MIRKVQESPWLGRLVIACGYSYFLLYAQFGFLDWIKQVGLKNDAIMVSMAICGISGSFLSLISHKFLGERSTLKIGLALCSISAGLALLFDDLFSLMGVAGFIGIGVSFATVSLASQLKKIFPKKFHESIAVQAGWGTGLAYFFCNIPFVFNASPLAKTSVAIFLPLVAILILEMIRETDAISNIDEKSERKYWDYSFVKVCVSIVSVMLILVWLDSSVFYIIQQTASLKSRSWHTDFQLMSQGCFHFAGALCGGYLLKNKKFLPLGFITWLLFACGFYALQKGSSFDLLFAGMYAMGISFYSTALVALPELNIPELRKVSSSVKAATLYGICGWLGSVLGIGMAQDLKHIPVEFVVGSGCMISVFFMVRNTKSFSLAFVKIALPLVIVFLPLLYDWNQSKEIVFLDKETAEQRGRIVYMNEGCINCHSQYIRPNSNDSLLYGPANLSIQKDTPPLIGNRRRGPDLTNAGLRKSEVWHKIHLKNPRAFQPNSIMPAYSHLFLDERGADLVSYLKSLGKDRLNDYWKIRNNYKVIVTKKKTNEHAKAIYENNCIGCHGSIEKDELWSAPYVKDGMIAPNLSELMNNFIGEGFKLDSGVKTFLHKRIRFGVPNGNMPGHEHLTDNEVNSLLDYLLKVALEKNLKGELE